MRAAPVQQFFTLLILGSIVGVLVHYIGSGRWVMGVALAGLILIAHAIVLALEFVLVAWIQRRDTLPRPTFAQMRRAWWAEVWHAPRVFCWDQPFRSRRYPDFLPAEARGQRGVLLVHGYLCNRGFWNPWMPRLRAAKVPHVAISLEPMLGSLSNYIPQIEEGVRRLEEATGLPPVIVAHSMGGLAVRAWLASAPGNDVRMHRVITLAAPHRGTWLAYLGHTTNALEMRPDPCPWRNELEAREPEGRFARFTCFYSHCDNVVFPASTGSLPGADNRHIPGAAHIHLLGQPEVFNEVLAWADGNTAPAAASGEVLARVR